MARAREIDSVLDKVNKLKGKLSWDLDLMDPMIVRILYIEGEREIEVFRFFIGEAIDCVGRKHIMDHLREIENSPWLTNWHKQEEMV